MILKEHTKKELEVLKIELDCSDTEVGSGFILRLWDALRQDFLAYLGYQQELVSTGSLAGVLPSGQCYRKKSFALDQLLAAKGPPTSKASYLYSPPDSAQKFSIHQQCPNTLR